MSEMSAFILITDRTTHSDIFSKQIHSTGIVHLSHCFSFTHSLSGHVSLGLGVEQYTFSRAIMSFLKTLAADIVAI